MNNNHLKQLILSSLSIALIYIMTMIKIPTIVGYFNLGDGLILLCSSFLNPFYAFLSSGIGSMLADVTSGYMAYAIFTLIIKGLEGFVVSMIINNYTKQNLAYLIGIMIMVSGYLIADTIINNSFNLALSVSIFNILQGTTGFIIAYFGHKLFKRFNNFHNI